MGSTETVIDRWYTVHVVPRGIQMSCRMISIIQLCNVRLCYFDVLFTDTQNNILRVRH